MVKPRLRVDVNKNWVNKILFNLKYNYWLDFLSAAISLVMAYLYRRSINQFEIPKVKTTRMLLMGSILLHILYLIMVIYVY